MFVRSKNRMDKHFKFVFDNRNRLLLRIDSYFSKLIILRSHEKVFHTKLEATLSNVRMKCWIAKGKQAVKTVLKNCFTCNVVKGKTFVPSKTPSLPNVRVNCSDAFESVDIDFAIPLSLKIFLVEMKTGTSVICFYLLSPRLLLSIWKSHKII